MRIKFVYKEEPSRGDGIIRQTQCEVVNAETGERLERVQSVAIQINASDMVPRMILEVIPDSIEIEAEAQLQRRFTFNQPAPVIGVPIT